MLKTGETRKDALRLRVFLALNVTLLATVYRLLHPPQERSTGCVSITDGTQEKKMASSDCEPLARKQRTTVWRFRRMMALHMIHASKTQIKKTKIYLTRHTQTHLLKFKQIVMQVVGAHKYRTRVKPCNRLYAAPMPPRFTWYVLVPVPVHYLPSSK